MRTALILASLLVVAPAAAEPLGAALAEAARTGDVKQHEALKGREFAQPVTVSRMWRDGYTYRDLLVTTPADMAHPEGARISLLVRIPVELLSGTPPKALDIRGQITDFEPVPVDGRLTWLPFVLAAEARAPHTTKPRKKR